MFKKLGFFLFAMGVSVSYAIAGGEPECYAQCDDKLDQCMIDQPNSPAGCTKTHQLCYNRCAPH